MSKKPLYIVDLIGDIITNVSSDVLAELQAVDQNIQAVNYFYGHPKEITETLAQFDQSDTLWAKKYPCVCLFQDFRESTGKQVGIASEVNLHLIIAMSTDPNYKAAERYANNFKPVLYPIYYSFLNNIMKSVDTLTASQNLIPHTKIDRVYWGKTGLYGSDGNIFNDRLDAIEITDLNLKFYQPVC